MRDTSNWKRKVKIKDKRVEIIYTDEDGNVVAHESIEKKLYDKTFPDGEPK